MSDTPDGHASEAAQQAGAVDEVERNTKSQTTAASYTTTDHEVIRAWAEARGARMIVHGHHHQSYTATLPNGIHVRGLGLAEPWLLPPLGQR